MTYSLEFFNKRQELEALTRTKAKSLAKNAETIRELVEITKSIEMIGMDEEIITEVINKVITLNPNTFSTEDLIWISRIYNFTPDLPSDGDENNTNYKGEIVIGERTFESFGEVVLETFYT